MANVRTGLRARSGALLGANQEGHTVAVPHDHGQVNGTQRPPDGFGVQMGKFRKRPVVIDAVHFTDEIARDGWPERILEMIPWLAEACGRGDVFICRERLDHVPLPPPFLIINTLEGKLTGAPGDWIIRGVKGEVYACKPDVFAATYEPA